MGKTSYLVVRVICSHLERERHQERRCCFSSAARLARGCMETPAAMRRQRSRGRLDRDVEPITDIGSVEIHRSQRVLWKSGSLAAEWARRFPELFDEEDRRLAGTQGPLGYHFYEWLAAIVLHHATGYLSLVSKYEFAKHRRKQEIIKQLLPADILPILRDRTEHGRAQPPDLLMYAPDFSDWFFCEVKGPGDRLRPEQLTKFEALAKLGGKPVRLLQLKWARAHTRPETTPRPYPS